MPTHARNLQTRALFATSWNSWKSLSDLEIHSPRNELMSAGHVLVHALCAKEHYCGGGDDALVRSACARRRFRGRRGGARAARRAARALPLLEEATPVPRRGLWRCADAKERPQVGGCYLRSVSLLLAQYVSSYRMPVPRARSMRRVYCTILESEHLCAPVRAAVPASPVFDRWGATSSPTGLWDARTSARPVSRPPLFNPRSSHSPLSSCMFYFLCTYSMMPISDSLMPLLRLCSRASDVRIAIRAVV